MALVTGWSYATRDDLKARLGLTSADTGDDAKIDMVLKACTRAIDRYTQRSYRILTATKYFTTYNPRVLLLGDDLVAITTLKTDRNGDRNWETSMDVSTGTTGDIDLEPINAASQQQPYTTIRTRPLSAQYFPTIRYAIEIAGKWGYWEASDSVGTLGAAISDSTGTSVTMTAGHGVETLMTILVGTEQMLVTAVSTNTLTVQRGANGTTAATASNGAAVSAMQYPEPIVEACLLTAARLFKRKDAPFGVTGSPELGFMRLPALDPDAKGLLAPYKSLAVGGF